MPATGRIPANAITSIAAPGRDHPHEHAEDDREDRSERDHRQRVQERRPEHVPHRLTRRERQPEVALGEILQVEPVLLELRLVEAELRAQRLAELGGAVAAAPERVRRVAGRGAEEDEVERERDEDREEREPHPSDDVVRAPHAPDPLVIEPLDQPTWCGCVHGFFE
jgi:hypothetical protein